MVEENVYNNNQKEIEKGDNVRKNGQVEKKWKNYWY